MAYTKSSFNKNTNTSTRNSTISNGSAQPAQNLWCRDSYWQYVSNTFGYNCFKETNGCRLRQCPFSASECRGAHYSKDIKPLKHISAFNRLDKSKYDWVSLYIGVIESFKRDSIKLIDIAHIEQVSNIILKEQTTFNLIEAIQLWRVLSCFYRKIQKEIPFKNQKHAIGNVVQSHISGYKYSDDVPAFYLDNSLEDVAWAFERITRYCNLHKKVEDALSRRQQITVWNLCLATGLNCKEGIHYQDEFLCPDNFLTGSCSCPTQESIDTKKAELQLTKLDLIAKLTTIIESEAILASTTYDNWQNSKGKKNKSKVITPDPKQDLRKQINQIDDQIYSLTKTQRMIHYTEQGMIPFSEQYQNYQIAQIELKRLAEQNAVKASWDHNIDATNITATIPVIKVLKLGKKK